ncbi:S1 family peptidase [Spirilliplanes yamanashiensis]|uniref:Peptidase S1A alpha-lytic prodomain domain-containing protein n=1 Tax=Spirilliplanes yamanashiensis TaxID=42233 RepID=A0A8J4DGQ7_9ACTN|nr:S1 family peptidase [Spirilliplanes yamanashiensis]MDP9819623.1 streptogrisin C [Spirilliplanes yamanashiensis]GIJ01557.1 hypothetical protein Sya03_09090 [Spirilliplanes yamanashiensis]
MQRKRIITVAAMVTVAGTAVALTLPAVADTRSEPERPARAESAPGDLSPDILSAMRRSRGVDADTARTLLQRSTWAARTTRSLAATTGAAYAGSWLAQDGMTLNVAVTDAAAADEVRQAGATPKLVDRSEHELDRVKAALDGNATRADRDLPGWYVDPATNAVVILAAPGDGDRARALADRAGVPADAVRVRTTRAQPRTFAEVDGGDGYLIDNEFRCSVGFAVEGGYVTAGHCGRPGSSTSDLNGEETGEFVASVFPGTADAGVVAAVDETVLRPVVVTDNGEVPVAGSDEAPVGAAVCRTGDTTGTECGRITSKNQTVNYPEGSVSGLTGTDVCAEGGDSGGPWLSGDQAQGVTSGGSGDCGANRDIAETFFQPVNEILTDNDLTLLTTGNAGGGDNGGGQEEGDGGGQEEGDGGGQEEGGGQDEQVDCTGLAAGRQGTLGRGDRRDVEPDNLFFRATAGTQVACLDVPDGAQFGLALQRFTGDGFQTVAESTGPGDRTLSFAGPAGTYRYEITRTAGSGAWTLGFDIR